MELCLTCQRWRNVDGGVASALQRQAFVVGARARANGLSMPRQIPGRPIQTSDSSVVLLPLLPQLTLNEHSAL